MVTDDGMRQKTVMTGKIEESTMRYGNVPKFVKEPKVNED